MDSRTFCNIPLLTIPTATYRWGKVPCGLMWGTKKGNRWSLHMRTADASVLFFFDRSTDSECFRTLNYEHDTHSVTQRRRAVPHGFTCVHRKSLQQQLLALRINESLVCITGRRYGPRIQYPRTWFPKLWYTYHQW
jgi:hypothetical protein